MFGRIRSLPGGPMAETFEAYRTRVLSYLGDEEPIGVQQATPSQLDRRLRDVAPEELIRRPAPEKWSIAEIVAHLADAELAMGWRLRNMLANPGVALTWWDQALWAERLGYAQQDASLSAGGPHLGGVYVVVAVWCQRLGERGKGSLSAELIRTASYLILGSGGW